MVNYTTRVIISSKQIDKLKKELFAAAPTPDALRNYAAEVTKVSERMAVMLEVLTDNGFQIGTKKDCIYGDSEDVEALAARQLLAEQGFADNEYQIYLEYRRQWGVM